MSDASFRLGLTLCRFLTLRLSYPVKLVEIEAKSTLMYSICNRDDGPLGILFSTAIEKCSLVLSHKSHHSVVAVGGPSEYVEVDSSEKCKGWASSDQIKLSLFGVPPWRNPN
jgi:hypothetical protein